MAGVTADVIRSAMPGCRDADGWAAVLASAAAEFDIDTDRRLAAFLAQIAVESTQLNHLEENLNYSAERLVAVWPNRFSSLASAQPYEHAPEKLANHVYANRNGNGDEASGDGWRYRGRGIIQITGRANYRAIGTALENACEEEPDLLLSPVNAARSAALFWKSRGLNELADRDGNFTAITVRINGSSSSDALRRQYWAAASRALNVA